MTNMLYAGTSFSTGGTIKGEGKGIYAIKINDDLSMEIIDAAELKNSGIISISSDKRFIYGAMELRDYKGNGTGGGIGAVRIKDDGTLQKINETMSYGSRPSYVSTTNDNSYLAVSNHGSHSSTTIHYVYEDGKYVLKKEYDDSSIAVFKLNEDGSVGEITDLMKFDHYGYWCNGKGQSTSHLHSVKIRKDNIMIACNRGADEIEVMKLNGGKIELINMYKTRFALAPRHQDFHPTKDILYVCYENYPMMGVFSLSKEGEIKELQFLKTKEDSYYDLYPVPDYKKEHCDINEESTASFMGGSGKVSPSDIHVSHNGKYVYVSNRRDIDGKGTIASYKVLEDGQLEFSGIRKFDGADLRGFNLSCDDEYLFVGIKEKNLIEMVRIDKQTGLLLDTVSMVEVPSPSSMINVIIE